MKKMNIFDDILYDVGDIVIRKNKTVDSRGNKPKEETVCKTEKIDSGTGYVYQILYFYSNPTSPHVAFEYEPFDEKIRAEYYKALKDNNNAKTRKKKETAATSREYNKLITKEKITDNIISSMVNNIKKNENKSKDSS